MCNNINLCVIYIVRSCKKRHHVITGSKKLFTNPENHKTMRYNNSPRATAKCYNLILVVYYTPIAFNEKVSFWLQSPGHCLVRVRLLHCMRVRLRNGYMQAYAQIMYHTRTHKAVTRRVEAKKLLSRRRQSKYSMHQMLLLIIGILRGNYTLLSSYFT